MIRKEAWPFYRTISGVRLCWELEEPKGPKGPKHQSTSKVADPRAREGKRWYAFGHLARTGPPGGGPWILPHWWEGLGTRYPKGATDRATSPRPQRASVVTLVKINRGPPWSLTVPGPQGDGPRHHGHHVEGRGMHFLMGVPDRAPAARFRVPSQGPFLS